MVHLQFGIFQGSDVQNLTPSDDFCESKMILVAASFLKGLTEFGIPLKRLVPETEIIRNLCKIRDFEVLAEDLF